MKKLLLFRCVFWSFSVLAVTSKETAMTTAMTSENCVKTGPCSCRTSSGGVLDLSPLADNVTARYKDVLDTQGADLYSWNPCLNFTQTPNCTNVAACQRSIDFKESKVIGTQASARFVRTKGGDLTLQYSYPDPSGVNRTTIVTLVCEPNGDSMIAVTGEMVAFQYSISLMSPHACIRKP